MDIHIPNILNVLLNNNSTDTNDIALANFSNKIHTIIR